MIGRFLPAVGKVVKAELLGLPEQIPKLRQMVWVVGLSAPVQFHWTDWVENK